MPLSQLLFFLERTRQEQEILKEIIIPSRKKNLLAVQTANNSCIESKKKNMINNDIEAPKGKHSACIVSNVANLPGIGEKEENVLVGCYIEIFRMLN